MSSNMVINGIKVVERLAQKAVQEVKPIASVIEKTDVVPLLQNTHNKFRIHMAENVFGKIAGAEYERGNTFVESFDYFKAIGKPVVEDLYKLPQENLVKGQQEIVKEFRHDLGNFGNFCSLLTIKLKELIELKKPKNEVLQEINKNCKNVFAKINSDFKAALMFMKNENTDFKSCLQIAKDSEKVLFDGKNIKFTVENEELLSRIKADENSKCQSFYTICRTLLENAGKYTPEGGEVKVIFKEGVGKNGESGLLAHFIDSGRGIPKGEEEKIFQTGFRGSNVKNTANKDYIGGTGYGLRNVADAAEKFDGGYVKVKESHLATEKTGKTGTVFEMFLPVKIEKPTLKI